MPDLNQTPKSNRLHIAIFGKRNAGKSSLINAITGQETALVSDVAGTTTDPVHKAMEVHPLGACVFIDTAGFDDFGELGNLRIKKTKAVMQMTDIAIVVFSDDDISVADSWIAGLKEENIPILAVINKSDTGVDKEAIKRKIEERYALPIVIVSAKTGQGIDEIKTELVRLMPQDFELSSIAGHMVSPKDVVLLVMPQDIQAPKGRLILPQVQTIRDLLDNKCIVISTTTDNYLAALQALKDPPRLIITDSQVFAQVYEKKPKESLLTSFSTLFARYKGDIDAFVSGAAAIDSLQPFDRVLIAESCTHAPLSEDIGRIKIPAMLKKRFGEGLSVDVVSGNDFPNDLSGYALIIHCGACMFNRMYVLSRIERANAQGVPITNYGVAIAKLSGILEKIDY